MKRKYTLDNWDEVMGVLGYRRDRPPTPAVPHAMDVIIPHLQPHYTDERFRHEQTVFLRSGYDLAQEYVKGAEYNYSDRLWGWDWNKMNAAVVKTRSAGLDVNTAAFWEAVLREFCGKPHLKLVHIMACFNSATGYPIQVFGYLPEGDSV